MHPRNILIYRCTYSIYNFKSRLDVVICGVELGAVIYGVELSARSSATSNRATKLDAVSHGVEMCNLDAVNHGIDPRVQS
jgi:hypothetical protein